MSNPVFPLRYLSLRARSGWPLLVHDIASTLVGSALLSAPFLVVRTTNYFHKDGFLDKFGTFSSVLTGFYVAGLVAIAAFSMEASALDEKTENGPVIMPGRATEEKERHLTRREYLCQMFGYLATLSMCLTLFSIIVVIVSQGFSLSKEVSLTSTRMLPLDVLRGMAIVGISIPVSHLVVTTSRGLYYFVDRIYDKKPVLRSKPNSDATVDDTKPS